MAYLDICKYSGSLFPFEDRFFLKKMRENSDFLHFVSKLLLMSTVVGIKELATRFNTVDNQGRFQDEQTILANVTLHVLFKSSVVASS